MKISTLTIALFFTLGFKAHAQDDYVITAKGDSIMCKIKIPFGGGTATYFKKGMYEPKAMAYWEVKRYYIADKKQLFQSVVLKGTKDHYFMNLLENGKIKLYEIKDVDYARRGAGDYVKMTNLAWFINAGADTVQEIKSTQTGIAVFAGREKRRDELSEMLKDNSQLYQLYVTNEVNFKDLRRIIHAYNTSEPF
jgi:hypothetical protein